jgi:prepilin-type N-terminal cleavage/methylation domain-containing protein
LRRTDNRGFSLIESIVALGVTVIVAAVIFDLVAQSRRRFDAEPDVADRQQRIRVSVDALSRDLLMASAVMPYRAAGAAPDPPGTFRDAVVTIVSERPAGEDDAVRSYYLRRDVASGASQLMRAEGGGGDAPVADGVTSLVFAYFGDPALGVEDPVEACSIPSTGSAALVPIAGAEFSDGPFCPASGGAAPFDVDLRRIRKIAIRIRVAGAAADVAFEVAPRNLHQER